MLSGPGGRRLDRKLGFQPDRSSPKGRLPAQLLLPLGVMKGPGGRLLGQGAFRETAFPRPLQAETKSVPLSAGCGLPLLVSSWERESSGDRWMLRFGWRGKATRSRTCSATCWLCCDFDGSSGPSWFTWGGRSLCTACLPGMCVDSRSPRGGCETVRRPSSFHLHSCLLPLSWATLGLRVGLQRGLSGPPGRGEVKPESHLPWCLPLQRMTKQENMD